VVLASNVDKPHGVAIDNNNVYFTTYSSGGNDFVASAPKTAGGAYTKLAQGQDLPSLMAIANQRLYWTNWTTGHVRSVGLPMGQVSEVLLPSGSGAPFGIASSGVGLGAKVFAVSYDTGKVFSIPLTTGGAAVDVGQTANAATSMVLVGDFAFVAVQKGAGAGLYRVNTTTKDSVNLATGANAWGVAASPGNAVYFSDHVIGAVFRVTQTPASVVAIAKNLAGPRGIAVDNTHVYWAEFGKGRVARVPRDTPSVAQEEIVATGLSGVTSIALDDQFVYFAAMDTGIVGKVAK
jgi:sugar lactone lactonase YvrE